MAKEFEVESLDECSTLVRSLRIRDAQARLHQRLLAFSLFVRLRLRELRLWSPKREAITLLLSDGKAGARGFESARLLQTPKLSARSDEALVSSVGAAADEFFATLVPGASLAVLADEFLSSGLAVTLCHRVKRSTTLRISHGMKRVEATLEAGGREYHVVRAPADDYWTHYFRSMTVSSRRVEIRAWSSSLVSTVERGIQTHVSAGSGAAVRRFAVDLKTNKVIQHWELTGPGGVPIKGTALRFK